MKSVDPQVGAFVEPLTSSKLVVTTIVDPLLKLASLPPPAPKTLNSAVFQYCSRLSTLSVFIPISKLGAAPDRTTVSVPFMASPTSCRPPRAVIWRMGTSAPLICK